LEDLPQEHHQYSPASSSITAGILEATTGRSSLINYSADSSEWSE
jgi:hypothetical protein